MMNSMRARPTPSFGQRGQAEGLVGIADVQHDPGGRPRKLRQIHAPALEGQDAWIDDAGLALRARHRDDSAVADAGRRPLRAHHARHAQLAADDRRVARPAAAIGDDGGRPLHHGLPVGIGHGGDQHLARLEPLQAGPVTDEPGRAHADLLADGLAGDDDWSVGRQQREELDGPRAQRAVHGLRSRLQHVEAAVDAVPGPLDVHRRGRAAPPTVVGLDGQRRPGQLDRLVVAQAQDGGLAGCDGGALGPAVRPENDLPVLGADHALEDRARPPRQRRLEEPERVGIDLAADDGLAQPVGGLDQHHAREAAVGVEREHHP
jgi:hypothetical protein